MQRITDIFKDLLTLHFACSNGHDSLLRSISLVASKATRNGGGNAGNKVGIFERRRDDNRRSYSPAEGVWLAIGANMGKSHRHRLNHLISDLRRG